MLKFWCGVWAGYFFLCLTTTHPRYLDYAPIQEEGFDNLAIAFSVHMMLVAVRRGLRWVKQSRPPKGPGRIASDQRPSTS